jgi:NADH:ubiquinone oxidoreductase subunit 6 (subunit J)
LMIFAIMLTRNIAKERGPRFNENWSWAVGIALIVFAAMFLMVSSFPGFNITPQPLSERGDMVQALGDALIAPNGFALPFEVASILLVAALIGSVFIARERK